MPRKPRKLLITGREPKVLLATRVPQWVQRAIKAHAAEQGVTLESAVTDALARYLVAKRAPAHQPKEIRKFMADWRASKAQEEGQ